MKCFLLGVLGALLGLVGSLVVLSQYSDYRAAAQTSGWMGEVEPAQRAVEANAARLGTLSGAGRGVVRPAFGDRGPERFEVTTDGVILMHGGLAGQMVALVPTRGPDGLRWHCLGGSKGDVSACKAEAVASASPADAGANAASVEAATLPSAPACLVSAQGVGPVRLGMTLEAAQQAMPSARFSRTSDGEGVALVELVLDGEALAVAYAGEEDAEQPLDPSRPIEYLETFNPACATAEGIHPGSTVEAAEAAYGPLRDIRRSEIESREFVAFPRQPTGLQFRLEEGGEFADGQSITRRHLPGATLLSIAVSRP